MDKTFRETVHRVELWVKENDYKGYDPFDVKGLHSLIWIQKNKYLRRAFNIVAEVFPIVIRRMCGVEGNRNAKAMGLFAKSYVTLFELTGDETYKSEAMKCLNWLLENRNGEYQEYCWGYPFDWQSRILIPKDTPSAVVTSIVSDSFLAAFDVFDEEQWLDVAVHSCEFIVKRLNVFQKSGDQLCFSYTPLDTFRVHNANLLSAWILFKVGMKLSNHEFLERAMQAVNYSVDEQNGDGSWYYWGNDTGGDRGVIDNFHTGFNLRSLHDIYLLRYDSRIEASLVRGYEFFKNNLILDYSVPKYTKDHRYPIDIHACAESILCLSVLSRTFRDAIGIAGKVGQWTLNNMYNEKGYFYYRKYPLFTAKIPFIRWGQAWMMLALSEYLAATMKR